MERNHVKQKKLISDMTEGNVIKQIIMFAIPLLLSTVFQQCYSLTDTIIVSHNLGENAIAAVGATTVISTLLIVFANGLNSGYGIIISRAFGAGDRKEIRKSVAAMIVLNIVITLVLTVLSVLFIKTVMRWLNTPEDIFEQAYRYIIIILAGMAATVCYNMCGGFLRAVGNSRTSLYLLIVSCILNVMLDVIFVAGLGMGVEGAASATVLAEGVSGILSCIYIFCRYREYLPGKEEFRLEPALMKEMFTTGMAMGIMLSINQLGSIILQRAINDLGATIIAAHTASRKIFEFMMMPLATLANANATFASQNFGAKKHGRIREGLKKTLFLEAGWCVISCIFAFPFGRSIIRMIANSVNPQIVENAYQYLFISVIFFFPLAVLFVLRTTFQSVGHKASPVFSSVIELSVKVLMSLFVIPQTGYWMVTVTEPITWVLCAGFLSIVYMAVIRRNL